MFGAKILPLLILISLNWSSFHKNTDYFADEKKLLVTTDSSKALYLTQARQLHRDADMVIEVPQFTK